MPFKDPLRMLILPPGISIPPPVGESALQLDAGPPPSIKLYTGSADEVQPADLRTAIQAGDLVLIINGPLTDNVAAAGQDQAFITLASDDAITNTLITLRATQVIIGGQSGPIADEAQIIALDAPFESTSGSGVGRMAARSDFDETNRTGLSNTAYTAPTGAPGFAFVAPPSGRGILGIHTRAEVQTTAALTRTVQLAPRLGTGNTIGGGTAQSILTTASPHDDFAVEAAIFSFMGAGTQRVQAGISTLVNLTPGNDYNLQFQARVSASANTTYDILSSSLFWLPLY